MPTALSMALKTDSTVPLLKLLPWRSPAAHLDLDLAWSGVIDEPAWVT